MADINPINILVKQRDIIESLKGHRKKDPNGFDKWKRDTQVAIKKIFGENSEHIKDFSGIAYGLFAISSMTPEYEFDRAYNRGLERAFTMIESMIDEIKTYGFENEASSTFDNPLQVVEKIIQRFHVVAKQIRHRHNNRETIEITDEYDVQDLLHGLLKIDFDDVRPEEYTPSYAGASTRVDFLLKKEKIIIEVKKTRKGLNTKEIGEQLIIDMARYKSHPDCETLVCFVYDPEERISNPVGLESDLEKNSKDIKVKVIISPK
ncbi:hypothetical protein H1224_21960 [Pectobacterium aroidearum]|uniref:PD-(D/E)XK nuclease domain-containing protein n=1 Tax=Pectobacterium aroidearum TaxID=1201031 RepID=UPI0015F49289|nr:hypothetical protein [Pectobacterium aroidearum]MBA5603711.1 hypothetical protein [Pectobacterium aroidearum]